MSLTETAVLCELCGRTYSKKLDSVCDPAGRTVPEGHLHPSGPRPGPSPPPAAWPRPRPGPAARPARPVVGRRQRPPSTPRHDWSRGRGEFARGLSLHPPRAL